MDRNDPLKQIESISQVIESSNWIIAIHVIFYGVLYTLIPLIICRFILGVQTCRKVSHPVIKKVFNVKKIIFISVIGSVIILSMINRGELCLPFVFLFLGIFYNIFGRFSNKTVIYFSWSYTLIGLVSLYLTRFNIDILMTSLTVYLGLSLIIIGLSLLKGGKTLSSFED